MALQMGTQMALGGTQMALRWAIRCTHQRSAHPHHRKGALEDSDLLLVRRQVHKVLRHFEVLIVLALLLGLRLRLGYHLVGRRPGLLRRREPPIPCRGCELENLLRVAGDAREELRDAQIRNAQDTSLLAPENHAEIGD
jgi:hypothetical protein